MDRADICIRRILKHEGGYVNHKDDPGGATNLGVTIGTLKRIGIDVDGDGDSDIADLRALRVSDAVKVYRRFYWDKVEADLLPVGVDYAVADYAVNSGVSRASKALQGIVGVKQDGVIGPKTLAAVNGRDPAALVNALCDQRMRFLRALSHWGTFGKGWTRRVDGVRADALADAQGRQEAPAAPSRPDPAEQPQGFWAALTALLARIFGGKS
ncbi:glycoside hydrolase family 108 protein [Citreimonas sp.]|uniref:glycoside hydrolase family 108 protein n=1 Tax=Citreimonas sp. TaxID=3036715 RepID=UPI004058734D